MLLRGKLYAESPIYRGNGRKTLLTRDGDGTQRLVSLAGEISGTAQALMDAFIGQSRDGKNIGLLNRLWLRLYNSPMPDKLITRVECKLDDACYQRDHFFDMRMGLKLDEDRWAAEANANYKMETIFRNSTFDFALTVNDEALQQGDNATRLYHALRELREGRFWFGAGKSKGLGRVRLEMDLPFEAVAAPSAAPSTSSAANHLRLTLTFDATNPVLVGWNWGKVDPEVPAFAAIEGRLLVGAMKGLPAPIRSRLELTIGGPILSPEDWKNKFAAYLPRVIAIWLREQSSGEVETWTVPSAFLVRLGKGKFPLAKDVIETARPLCDKPFAGRAALEATLKEALGKKANMAKRILEGAESKRETSRQLNQAAWQEAAQSLGLDASLKPQVAERIQDEAALAEALSQACRPILPRLFDQADQQINLLQSDAWVDAEIAAREAHLLIKTMLLDGKIAESQWDDRSAPPQGVSAAAWRSFLDEHSRVKFQHLLAPGNLRKSITNDRNFIAFLAGYRDKARQELAQPHHVDFRAGGSANREISQKYGKPYDTVFMRMLVWSPVQQDGAWEIYIPGSTLKGAFRRRASQVLKTLWGESRKTTEMLDRLFGAQRRRGLLFFSDAHLADPRDTGRAWCSMDGVRMDPATGQPIESAKRDYLFAYGDQLVFSMTLDLQDVSEADTEALSVLNHLIGDFRNGDIPLGGEKTSGFGWVKAAVSKVEWMATDPKGLTAKLFGQAATSQDGVWHKLALEGQAAADALKAIRPIAPEIKLATAPIKTSLGFTSHRAFGGYCGTLHVQAEVLTPTNVRESGQPSFTTTLDGGPVNGWDFFALASPRVEQRDADKVYALPSRSLRGMLRHLYAIASDSKETSPDIGHLNPADSLFGWVGVGPNQAIMGRLSFGFGIFDPRPELAWFKVPYPYGKWKLIEGEWQTAADTRAAKHQIEKTWRMFPHARVAPLAKRLDGFAPDTVQASYFRAILPGARARFTIRFWNLDEQELQRLMWCVSLEPTLAHKVGNNRYLGFGSVRLHVLPESFTINWENRYKPGTEWRTPLRAADWIKPGVVAHYQELIKALDAKRI